MPPYPPPIDRLLNYGKAQFREDFPDYVAELGLTPEHLPDLARMVADRELYEGEGDELRFYGPIHARRALGQLRDPRAVAPLFAAMDEFIDFDDFWTEELAGVIALIGPPALPALAEALADPRHDESTRISAASSLEEIGKAHPEARAECVRLLAAQLDRRAPGVPALNGFVVSSLLDLNAVEAAPTIETAFAADVVDEMVAGDWPRVRFELGLGPEPPPRRYGPHRLAPPAFGGQPGRRPDLKKLKQKQQAQKRARKQNRRGR